MSAWATAGGQLSIGVGPTARSAMSVADPSGWEFRGGASALARMDWRPLSLDAEGTFDKGAVGPAFGEFSLRSTMRSPSAGGFRLVTSAELANDRLLDHQQRSSVSTSVVFNRGATGGWLGSRRERSQRLALTLGAWRQLDSRMTVSVSSVLRRASVGGTPSRFWTETVFDSIYTDTSGWQRYPIGEHLRGDSGTAASRVGWAETEAHLSWSAGRIALDGVAGYRQRIDSLYGGAFTASAFATVALARSVALSLGGGSMSSANISAGSTKFFSASIKLAPASLVRPKQAPEIIPVVAAFSISPSADSDFVVRIRLPRARVVELSGDFNGWTPVRLTSRDGNTWETALRLTPGTYHMNVRIDGAGWIAPPGVPAVDDEFNGRVGLIVIR